MMLVMYIIGMENQSIANTGVFTAYGKICLIRALTLQARNAQVLPRTLPTKSNTVKNGRF